VYSSYANMRLIAVTDEQRRRPRLRRGGGVCGAGRGGEGGAVGTGGPGGAGAGGGGAESKLASDVARWTPPASTTSARSRGGLVGQFFGAGYGTRKYRRGSLFL